MNPTLLNAFAENQEYSIINTWIGTKTQMQEHKENKNGKTELKYGSVIYNCSN
jgi:hypothetical protein